MTVTPTAATQNLLDRLVEWLEGGLNVEEVTAERRRIRTFRYGPLTVQVRPLNPVQNVWVWPTDRPTSMAHLPVSHPDDLAAAQTYIEAQAA